jgi:hypothetical protein
METRPTRNDIMASVTELADYIRKKGSVKFGRVCVDMHIAPSTLHGWKKVLLDTHEDIKYNHGVFMVERHHRIPDGKLISPQT